MGTKIKYSIIIPTLNGYSTLSKTLPEMLKIDRDDIEWVISDNCSDDDLYNFVNTIDDCRLKLVRPKKRLPIGSHLDFAYRHASGEWQSHLGDDDYLLSSRFKLLDQLISRYSEADIFRGDVARYYWHDFPASSLANKLSPSRYYTSEIKIYNGRSYAHSLLNEKNIYSGGSWVVKKNIIDRVRNKIGYFSPPQTVEFFSMRASSYYANQIIEFNFPIWINGRHAKSFGSQNLMDDKKVKNTSWDWSVEDPDDHVYCPYQYKGYIPISMDATLQFIDCFSPTISEFSIDREYWAKAILSETEYLIKENKLNKHYRKERNATINKELGFKLSLLLKSNLFRLFYALPASISNSYISQKSKIKIPNEYCFGWDNMTSAKKKYQTHDIIELANILNDEVEKNEYLLLGHDAIL